jgi:hypothetical protein
MHYAPNHPAWKTASDPKTASGASMADYFASFAQTLAYSFEASMGLGWKLDRRVTTSNTELTGAFIIENPKTRGQISVSLFADGKAVKAIASAILVEGRFDVHGGGSVFIDANEMGRNLANLVHGHITRLNPDNLTVR